MAKTPTPTLREQLVTALAQLEAANTKIIELTDEVQSLRSIVNVSRAGPADNGAREERKRIMRLLNRVLLRTGEQFVETPQGRRLVQLIEEGL